MSAPTPPVEKQYAYSLYSSVPTTRSRSSTPSARTPTEEIPQPWLVFEAKDDDGRLVLWKKWLELREAWAGDSARWM